MDVDGQRPQADALVKLLSELSDFIARHRPCGQLTGDATEPAASGYLLTVGCACGVVFMRWVTPEGAVRELLLSDLLTTGS